MTMNREISAGVIIYRKTAEGNKFLLLYHGGSYWNFPKGKLEHGERGIQAALREVKEETGISQKDLALRANFRMTNKFYFFRGKDRVFKVVIFYLAETKISKVEVSDEHDGYAWLLYRDAVKILKHQNTSNILKKANNLITHKKQQHHEGQKHKETN